MKRIYSKIQAQKASLGLPIIALIWVSIFWGTTWLASKEGVKYMPAFQLAGVRQLIAGLCYIAFFLWKKEKFPKGKQWVTIFILALLNFTFSNGLSTWGIKYISSGLGAIIGAIFPLWIVLFSLIKGEKIKRNAIIGLLVCFGGILVIFNEYLADFINPNFIFGIVLSVISTITWAAGSIYTKEKASDFNPYFSLGLQLFISSILILGVTSATGNAVSMLEIPLKSWLAIGYLVIIGSILTSLAFVYALQKLPTELSSIYAYINPIIAILLGSIVFGEPLTFLLLIGGMITLLGLYMINNSLKKKSKS